MNRTKKTLIALIDIMRGTDEDHPITASQICRLLSERGLDAERRSIGRDLHLLADSGFDIVWCSDKKQGCFLGSRLFEEWELKVMIDALFEARFLTDVSCRHMTSALLSTASPYARKKLQMSTVSVPRRPAENKSIQNNIHTLMTAIGRGRQVSFQYCTYDRTLQLVPRRARRYTVEPRRLYWNSDFYYLLCTHPSRDSLTSYRLDRMKDVQTEAEGVRPDRAFPAPGLQQLIAGYMQNITHHYSGQNRIILQLQVPAFMMDHLIDQFGQKCLHTSAARESASVRGSAADSAVSRDDSIDVKIEAAETEGLYFWLMQYGSNLKIISPEHVRSRYLEQLRSIMAKY